MSGLLGMTPRIRRDVAGELVVEESHIPGWVLVTLVLLVCSVVTIEVVRPGKQDDLIFAFACSGVCFGYPLLIVFVFSSYRRLTIRAGREVVAERVNRMWPARTTRIGWHEITRLTCLRRVWRFIPRPATLVVTADLTDGSKHTLLRGWFADAVADALQRHFGDRLASVA